MNRLQLQNKWVLVTGASSGLGREMAYQLAVNHKTNLWIVARRKEKLENLKNELEQKAGVQVKIIVADLSIKTEVDKVVNACLANNDLYGAILNAGVTYFGYHTELPEDRFESIMQINVNNLVRMSTQFVQHFEQTQKEGGIMLISSMGAFFPVPYQAVYSATKAFILNFANALAYEVQNPNFSVTVFLPGGVKTEMTEGEEFDSLKKWLMPVDTAAKEAIYAFIARKHRYIPGFFNRIGHFFMNLLPPQLIISQMSKMYAQSLKKVSKK